MGKDKTISSGGSSYRIRDVGDNKSVTKAEWGPRSNVGTAKDEAGAINIIKSDSGSDKTKEK
jgi:hypothetical protein